MFRSLRLESLPLLFGAAVALAGCAGGHAIVPQTTHELVWSPPVPVAWFGPQLASDADVLARWRRAVGPPIVVSAGQGAGQGDRLIVVNWNVHVGGGDIRRLFHDIRQQAGPDAPLVFLLQEAYRSGPEVPGTPPRGGQFAAAIRGVRPDGRREEIESVASALGMHVYYVPSMRNGGSALSDEDRGNAILSTLPLRDLAAIELPFERQRRVAVAATVEGTTSEGQSWRLRVVSAHLDNLGGARRLWVAGSEFGRTRQTRGLLAALDGETPVVLGADMNTLFGFLDRAYTETARAFPDTRVTDRRATFRGLLRLDHLFFRLDGDWRAEFRRADDSYGSDHHPLIGTVTFASRQARADGLSHGTRTGPRTVRIP